MRRAVTAALAALLLPHVHGCENREASGTEARSASTETTLPGWAQLGTGVTTFRQTRTDSTGAAVTWVVVRADLESVRIRAMELAKRRLDAVAEYRAAIFAVNGGYFEPDFKPSGLLIEDGRIVSDWQERGGSGALVVRGKRASIASDVPAETTSVELAVQCGPRLVEPGGVPGIEGDDGKRAERTAACIRRGGRELNFVIAAGPSVGGAGPTLYQFAAWLAAPLSPGESGGCDSALNLDGGPSTGVVARKFSRQETVAPRGPVPWALVAIER
jgi:uncharacterized protein YigE (DUF2233 family)